MNEQSKKASSMFSSISIDHQKADISDLKWSFSRNNLLEQCSLRYYFYYFGGSMITAHKEPDKEILHNLKSGTYCHQYAGELLHRIIQQYFSTRSKRKSFFH